MPALSLSHCPSTPTMMPGPNGMLGPAQEKQVIVDRSSWDEKGTDQQLQQGQYDRLNLQAAHCKGSGAHFEMDVD